METPAGLTIRPELSNDDTKITQIYEQAFVQSDERKLVEALRRNPLLIKGLSLVALIEGQLVGHILFFPVLIKGEGKVFRSLALAPMAVLREFQCLGIGTALVYGGLDEARAGKFGSVIVQGHRDFYPRFGFRRASGFGIFPPFDVPDDAFFAMELQPDGLSGVNGIVEYPPEFLLVMKNSGIF